MIIAQEVQRKSGMAIQTEEEQLRAQLEALNNQIRAPQQFRGKNILLISIKLCETVFIDNNEGVRYFHNFYTVIEKLQRAHCFPPLQV